MLFPIRDDNRGVSGPVYVTYVLLVLNILLFLYQVSHPEFTYGWSVIPREIITGQDIVGQVTVGSGEAAVQIPQTPGPTPIYLTLLTAMFMHGGLAHIGGNMLYLWIFGDNVEHRFGHFTFLGFYLVSGLAATFAQIAVDPDSLIPNLGASGAISGVLGAYLVLFPRNRVHAFFLFQIISIPAFVVIGLWAVMQFINGAGSIAMTEQTGGVAYAAHIGGFVAGVVMALILRMTRFKQEPDSDLYRHIQRDSRARRLW